MQRSRISLVSAVLLACAACPVAGQVHIGPGAHGPGLPPTKLFTAGFLNGASGHGPIVAPGSIIPITRINLISSYAQPRFGGYSFSTSGTADVGLDYAASPYNLDINLLPGPPSDFSVRLRRLGYGRPADFAFYTPTGSPRMVEDGEEYAFGTATNGGHVHPLVLIRRPGVVRWDMQFTSDQWLNSDPYTYYFTSVPGRGSLVPLNTSSIFNADVVDSDGTDAPTTFDGAGNSWVLNGHYGTSAGLPAGGGLDGFQLAGLTGSNLNCLFDNGVLSLAATLDLVATSRANSFLGLEFLVAGAGSFTTSDVINVTFTYSDDTTRAVAIRQGTADWLPYRPIDAWQQTATPRPWTAVGRSGDRSLGFARSTGSAIDAVAGENFFFFRACTPLDSTRMLKSIAFADYTGSNRVGIFAILGIKKAPLVITTAGLPPASENQPYSVTLAAEGTPPFKNWSAIGLPAGLSIDANTGILSGTPASGSAAGSPYPVDISCSDSINDFDPSYSPETANVTLNLVVSALPLPGDIDGNGVVNAADRLLFISVLLGLETNPTYVQRSDLNGDTRADGRDVQPFVAVWPG